MFIPNNANIKQRPKLEQSTSEFPPVDKKALESKKANTLPRTYFSKFHLIDKEFNQSSYFWSNLFLSFCSLHKNFKINLFLLFYLSPTQHLPQHNRDHDVFYRDFGPKKSSECLLCSCYGGEGASIHEMG